MFATVTIVLQCLAVRIYNNCQECLNLCFVGFSVRTKCIQGTFTFCSCLGEACCVNRGLRNRASWPLLSTLTSTYSIWSHLMVTCFPWSMKVLSEWVHLINARCETATLLHYVSIYIKYIMFYSEDSDLKPKYVFIYHFLFHLTGVLLGKWPNKPLPHSQRSHDLASPVWDYSTDMWKRRLCAGKCIVDCWWRKMY